MDREGLGGPAPGPVRIHRVIARLNVGGPAMHVVHLARALDDGPFRTLLVAGRVTRDEGDMGYYAARRAVPVHDVPTLDRRLRPLRDLRAFVALLRLFLRERPALVHTHTAKAGALGRTAAVLARVPVRIHTFHGHVLGGSYFSGPVTRAFRMLEKLLARFTHRIVALSEGQAEELATSVGVAPRERFRVIPLGLELEPFAEARERRQEWRSEVRRAEDIPADALVVGMVGRMVAVKNHELFLEALARLPEELDGRPVQALIVGSGEREAALHRLADELGVRERTRWLGWRRDLPPLYAAMDALALTSHDEGTPVAVVEALCAGVPVAARAVGGVPDVLEHGRHGRLVQEATPEAMAEALQRLLTAPPPPADLEAAARSVRERFAVERMVEEHRRLYLEELARAGAAR